MAFRIPLWAMLIIVLGCHEVVSGDEFGRSPSLVNPRHVKSRLVEESIRVTIRPAQPVRVVDSLVLANQTDADEIVALQLWLDIGHHDERQKNVQQIVDLRVATNGQDVPSLTSRIIAKEDWPGIARLLFNWDVMVPKGGKTHLTISYKDMHIIDGIDYLIRAPCLNQAIWLDRELIARVPTEERSALASRLTFVPFSFDTQPSNAWADDIGKQTFEVNLGPGGSDYFVHWEGHGTIPLQKLSEASVGGSWTSLEAAGTVGFSIMPEIRQVELQKLLENHMAKNPTDPGAVLMNVGMRLANNGTIDEVEPLMRSLLIASKNQVAIAGSRAREPEAQIRTQRILSAIEQSVLRDEYKTYPALFRLNKLNTEVDDVLRVLEKQIQDADGTVISRESIEQRVREIRKWNSAKQVKPRQ